MKKLFLFFIFLLFANPNTSYAKLIEFEKCYNSENIFNSSETEYEKIENVRDDKEQELLTDLRERTGLKIHKVSVVYIDFVKDSAELKIYFY